MARQRPDALDVYARVSRLMDDRQRSTEGQVDDSTARVLERGAELGEVHVDSGRSAWNPRVHRPGWDRLMQRLEAGETGGVVVFDLARFSRQPIEGERLIAAAERGLVILDSEDEYDLTSASGKKAFRDQLASAAYESDRLSTRVRRGKKLAAVRGEAPVSMRPFGFEPDGVTVREQEAAVLRELTELVLAGEPLESLLRLLAGRGITTSAGGQWSRQSLRRVLDRPRNAGLVEYKGEIVSRFADEAIVSEETYRRVAALFAARRRGRPTSNRYLCSGIAQCGICGHPLTGRSRLHLRPYPDGVPRHEYCCQQRAVDGGCGRLTVDMRQLDLYIRAIVVKVLGDPRHAATVEAEAQAAQAARAEAERELAECEQLLEVLDGRLGRREIDLARYNRTVQPLERDIAELRAKIAAAAAEAPGVASEADVAASREEWGRRWDEASVPERRNLIRRALRGRLLVVMPLAKGAPRRVFDASRIVIAPPPGAQPGPADTAS